MNALDFIIKNFDYEEAQAVVDESLIKLAGCGSQEDLR